MVMLTWKVACLECSNILRSLLPNFECECEASSAVVVELGLPTVEAVETTRFVVVDALRIVGVAVLLRIDGAGVEPVLESKWVEELGTSSVDDDACFDRAIVCQVCARRGVGEGDKRQRLKLLGLGRSIQILAAAGGGGWRRWVEDGAVALRWLRNECAR